MAAARLPENPDLVYGVWMTTPCPTPPVPWLLAGKLLWLLNVTAADAAGLRFLLEQEVFCAPLEALCVDGSITYEPNSRLLALGGRITATRQPGDLVVVLLGHQRDGTARYAEMRIPVEGRYSEVVRHRMVPDWPEIDDWAFDHAEFHPADEDGPQS